MILKKGSGGEFGDPFIKGLRRVGRVLCIADRDEIKKHRRIHDLWYSRRPKGLHFAREQKLALVMVQKEGFFAKAIPGQKERLFPSIPECESKHPVKIPDAIGAIEVVGSRDNLGIGTGAKGIAFGLQEIAKLDIVIDLSVVDDEIAVQTGHRLAAGRARIDDGQAAVSQADPAGWVEPMAFAVRPPVGKRAGHGTETFRGYFGRIGGEDSCNAAHGPKLSNFSGSLRFSLIQPEPLQGPERKILQLGKKAR